MHAQACLNARKDREICFLHCGGPVKPVPAYLSGKNDWEISLHH